MHTVTVTPRTWENFPEKIGPRSGQTKPIHRYTQTPSRASFPTDIQPIQASIDSIH